MAIEFKNFEFCDDFGEGPLLLGRITDDRSIISVVSLLGAFIAMAALGLPGAALVAFAALNDFSYAGKTETDRLVGSDTTPIAIAESDPIDATAETVVSAVDEPIAVEPIALVESIEVTMDSPIAQTTAVVAPSMVSFASKDAIELRDIATDLGNHPQSALIFGTPGAGKGMTISNAIRTLRSKLPNLTIMMVDPKGDKKERGYWESQVDIFEARALLKTSPRSSAEWMLRCVEKFQNLDGPKLLIWDELFASITVLKGQNIPKGEDAFPCLTEFQQFISLNLSLGPSSGIWVWGMSQSANLSDLGLTSGGLSTTRIVALISPDNVGAVEGYLATKAITAPKGGMAYLDELMSQSPVGRACYDGKTKRWYSVAKLQNHSGFDRDNADWNNLATVQTTPIALPSDITGTWREDFAKNLPPGLSESDFKARYDLEKSLREPSVPVETPIAETTVETMAVIETNSRSSYDDWNEYPVHQAILVYLQGKADKTDRNVYDSIKKKIDSEQWESIPGTDNMAKLKNVLSYLTNTKKVIKVSPNSYSAVD